MKKESEKLYGAIESAAAEMSNMLDDANATIEKLEGEIESLKEENESLRDELKEAAK